LWVKWIEFIRIRVKDVQHFYNTYIIFFPLFLTLQASVRGAAPVERGIHLEGLSEAQIVKALEDLVKVGASLKA
jgi:hypothetical protein